MKLILMMASLLIVAYLVLQSYPGGVGKKAGGEAGGQQFDPVKKAEQAEQLILDAAKNQRQALEKQLQQ